MFRTHIPDELIQQIFAYIPPSQVNKYRRLNRRICACLTGASFALENIRQSCATDNVNNKNHITAVAAGSNIWDIWFTWPIEHQFQFTTHYAVQQTLATTHLMLDSRNITGLIPHGISHLLNLTVLSLRSNNLCGNIPDTIGKLVYLQTLDLSQNKLSGSIPSTLRHLINIRVLSLGDNNLTGTIPGELSELSFMHTLNLKNNFLIGGIPQELGKLKNLQFLYVNSSSYCGGGKELPDLHKWSLVFPLFS
ncbi:hypothetical protein HK100_001329 [Physocladia obscura]|uniref:L domain-like protein n=1 Tax=Physocladia obscura TaxID=109957 RepID=A0AAD5SYQ5_9FUNG|nr:hypothetical protein HK100_001329 [Physocladia obscura]